jgi:hypothetical protein
MAIPDETPSFTLIELYEINDAVMPVLRCYLEDGDPEQHEQQYRSVSTLLEIVRKLNLRFAKSSGVRRENGLPDWFPDLEQQVCQFRERAMEMARQGAIPASYAWDYWKTKALAAGVAVDLAELGRAVMREHYQHGWSSCDDKVSVRSGDEMIKFALSDPDRAALRWQWLLDTDGGKHVSTGSLN